MDLNEKLPEVIHPCVQPQELSWNRILEHVSDDGSLTEGRQIPTNSGINDAEYGWNLRLQWTGKKIYRPSKCKNDAIMLVMELMSGC